MDQNEEKKPLKYNGFFKNVNSSKDLDQWIEIFVSDWNKEYWAFYVYIDLDDLETSLEEINNFISEMNWRDGDYYTELIDHDGSEDTEKIYNAFYDRGGFDHNSVLWLDNWEEIQEKLENAHPDFNDFDTPWDCFDYIEQFYDKDTMYDKLVAFLDGNDIRLMYERFTGDLF